jgi:hypothetical protein
MQAKSASSNSSRLTESESALPKNRKALRRNFLHCRGASGHWTGFIAHRGPKPRSKGCLTQSSGHSPLGAIYRNAAVAQTCGCGGAL